MTILHVADVTDGSDTPRVIFEGVFELYFRKKNVTRSHGHRRRRLLAAAALLLAAAAAAAAAAVSS